MLCGEGVHWRGFRSFSLLRKFETQTDGKPQLVKVQREEKASLKDAGAVFPGRLEGIASGSAISRLSAADSLEVRGHGRKPEAALRRAPFFLP